MQIIKKETWISPNDKYKIMLRVIKEFNYYRNEVTIWKNKNGTWDFANQKNLPKYVLKQRDLMLGI